jgi:hypothetical protein
MFFFLVRSREYKSGRDNQQHSRLRSVTRSSNHCPTSFLSPIHPFSYPVILPLPHSPFLLTILPTQTSRFSLLPASTTTPHFLEKKSIFLISHSRNIGCENSRICFFSSFDCANINRDVITTIIADFGP